MSHGAWSRGAWVAARIVSLGRLSNSVKAVTLKLTDPTLASELAFQSGQWVNFRVPSIRQIGGYSMTSTPRELREGKTLSFAVKLAHGDDVDVNEGDSTNQNTTNDSTAALAGTAAARTIVTVVGGTGKSNSKLSHEADARSMSHVVQPAHWIHHTATVGDKVSISVGGSARFRFGEDNGEHLVCIVGGIGITPIVSIIRHYLDKCPDTRLSLLYSAPSVDDFIFREEFLAASERSQSAPAPRLRSTFFLTQSNRKRSANLAGDPNAAFVPRRITESDIRSAMNNYDTYHELEKQRFILCGPSGMIDNFSQLLKDNIGVHSDRIHFEKWW